MFKMEMNLGNTIGGCLIFLTGCCLAVISVELDSSGTFAMLYILLGITGFLVMFLLRPKKMDKNAKSVQLKSLNSDKKQDSEKSVINCKILAAELLNTAHIITEQKRDRSSSSKSIGSDLELEQMENIRVVQTINLGKTESITERLEENPIKCEKLLGDDCKILEAKFLNTDHITIEQKLGRTLSSNSVGPDLLLEQIENTGAVQTIRLMKTESITQNLEEKVNNCENLLGDAFNRDKLKVDGLPLIAVEDTVYDFELPHPEQMINWHENSPIKDILSSDINGRQYRENFIGIAAYGNNDRYNNKFYSSTQESMHTDFISMPPVKTGFYPKQSISEDKISKIPLNKSCILERKLSSESTCFSSLCVNLLSEPISSGKNFILKVPQKPFGSNLREGYCNKNYSHNEKS